MGELATIDHGPMELSVSDVTVQVGKLQELMKSIMHDGEHYGVIPGTNKPSLYKAGAEKIGFIFRLAPEFEIDRDDLPNGHREYRVLCKLRHMGTQVLVGEGVGSCSTMESKYRWRNESVTEEVGPVPKEYWDTPKEDFSGRAKALENLYGPGKYKPKKTDSGWVTLKVTGDGGRVENPDIADQYNTVLKMAKKRAYVDATITATAASDFFTQDVEDFMGDRQGDPEMRTAEPTAKPERKVSDRRKAVIDYVTGKQAELTAEQLAEIRADLKAAGDDDTSLDLIEGKVNMFLHNVEAIPF